MLGLLVFLYLPIVVFSVVKNYLFIEIIDGVLLTVFAG